jgi:hypothetical protein
LLHEPPARCPAQVSPQVPVRQAARLAGLPSMPRGLARRPEPDLARAAQFQAQLPAVAGLAGPRSKARESLAEAPAAGPHREPVPAPEPGSGSEPALPPVAAHHPSEQAPGQESEPAVGSRQARWAAAPGPVVAWALMDPAPAPKRRKETRLQPRPEPSRGTTMNAESSTRA